MKRNRHQGAIVWDRTWCSISKEAQSVESFTLVLNTELMHHAAFQKVSRCLSGGQQESVRCWTSMAALSHLTTSSLSL